MEILSIDFGTSSVKISIVNDEFEILDSAKVPYEIRVLNGDWAELDASEVFDAMIRGIRTLTHSLDSLGLITFDSFAPSLVFMDSDGDPLYPLITHLDRRSKKQTQDILNLMGKERFQSITGIQPFTGGASITTVLWIKENEPDVFKKTCKLGHFGTYVYKKLTGVWITDPTNASMTGMYETTKWGSWSSDICAAFHIPAEKLPEIELSGVVAGHLTVEAACLLGLKQGLPVAVGSHDTTVAHAAAGNTQPGDILNISGSSEMVSILTDKPIVDDRYYLRNAIIPGQWQIFAITASGFVIDWFRREFYRDMDEKTFFASEFPSVIENHVGKTQVGFLPYLAGDRQSLEPKTGGFTGLTFESTRRDFLASILTGIHEPLLSTIRLCEERMHLNKTIKLSGGMITPAILSLKKTLLPGYRFEVKNDGPSIGTAMIALDRMKS